jgi:predicted RND superfamily exporter protein
MPKANEQEFGIFLLAGMIVLFFLVLFLFGFMIFLKEFISELKSINREIARTKGNERRYYIRRRRRLWLSLLPFIKY